MGTVYISDRAEHHLSKKAGEVMMKTTKKPKLSHILDDILDHVEIVVDDEGGVTYELMEGG